MKEILTVQKLKDMKAGTIFDSGILNEDTDVVRGKKIKWVACRGKGYWDWCIYYHTPDKFEIFIQTYGDKMFTESIIRKLVPCDNMAWGLYRM